jgi:6-phosphogluconolactonase (cycloisomerase 2 family)
MEMKERMSKRLWLLGVFGLVLVALLVACGSNYNRSQDGLLLVGSQGSGVIETFSFTLSNGHVSAIANSPNSTANKTCVLNGIPSSLVMHPAGTYAYAIINENSSCSGSQTGVAVFKVGSDGNVTQAGGLVSLNQGNIVIQGTAAPNNTESVTMLPNELSIDSTGKFLFVADRATTDSANRSVPGGVSVFTIGSDGSLSEVAGSPFFASSPAMTLTGPGQDIVSVAATPTVFPGHGINVTTNSVCQTPGNSPPTAEYLYAVDGLGYQVFAFAVDTSSGALGIPPNASTIPSFATDKVPAGIAVDPCDRFVYVSNSLTNKVSAYTIGFCSSVPSPCPFADGSLTPVTGSPFSVSGNANGLGPIVVDPYGNNVYVVGTLSNTISPFKISPVSGAINALNPATIATGLQPTAIAIRGDDNWMFVSNFNAATVSQYSITPATGALAAQAPIQTDNYPFGVAVK